MVLAEALLRVPDAATADRLIEDKIGQGDFVHHETRSDAFLVSASAWALGITARVIQPGETPEGILGSLAKRIGVPTVRTATRQAMRVLGSHFVLGQSIGEALDRARSGQGRLFRYSFDMLGEGARTQDDAERYAKSYADAIDAIGKAAGNEPLPNRPGISVKLSALHPRYDALSQRPGDARTGAGRRPTWRSRPRATTSTSQSTPRKPTGSNSRSTSSPPCWQTPPWRAGTASASPSRPTRSARLR